MGMATSSLLGSIVGPKAKSPMGGLEGLNKHRKLVSPKRMTVGTVLSYAPKFNEKRPFNLYDKKNFWTRIEGAVNYYIRTGKVMEYGRS